MNTVSVCTKKPDATDAKQILRIGMAPRFCLVDVAARATPKLVSANRCANFLELSICVSTDSTDSSQANDDDQSKHDGVLNCSWAIFFFKKFNDAVCEVFHFNSLLVE